MKDTYYFPHDYNARNDPKLQRVVMKLGMTGLGCYWSIVEMLYEEGGYLRIEYDRISFELRIEENVIRQLIEDFELFKIKDGSFYSSSVLERIEHRMSKSVKCKESINKRWQEYRRNTNVKQTNNERNTRKGKERKGNIYKAPEFYLNEIQKATEDKKTELEGYVKFVDFLFGRIGSNGELKNVLAIKEQVTYEQYTEIVSVYNSRSRTQKLSDILLQMENTQKYTKDKKSLYLTLRKWLQTDYN